MDRDEERDAESFLRRAPPLGRWPELRREDCVTGAILGSVELEGWAWQEQWGLWAWRVQSPRLLASPIVVKGKLGLWLVPAALRRTG